MPSNRINRMELARTKKREVGYPFCSGEGMRGKGARESIARDFGGWRVKRTVRDSTEQSRAMSHPILAKIGTICWLHLFISNEAILHIFLNHRYDITFSNYFNQI